MVEAIRVHRFVYCLGSSLAFEILIAFTVQSEMRKIVQKSNVVNFASLTLNPSSSLIRLSKLKEGNLFNLLGNKANPELALPHHDGSIFPVHRRNIRIR